MKVLLALTVTNLDEAFKKYTSLRRYMSDFKKTTTGEWISEANVIKNENGKYVFPNNYTDDVDLFLALFDWGFNEDNIYVGDDTNGQPIFENGDSKKFFKLHPEGFKLEKARVLCII